MKRYFKRYMHVITQYEKVMTLTGVTGEEFVEDHAENLADIIYDACNERLFRISIRELKSISRCAANSLIKLTHPN